MFQRSIGALVTVAILAGVVLILLLNLNIKTRSNVPSAPPRPLAIPGASLRPAGFREFPIGDEAERNQMRIAAVWLPPIQMEGMGARSRLR